MYGKILHGIVIADVSLVWHAWCWDVWEQRYQQCKIENREPAIILAILSGRNGIHALDDDDEVTTSSLEKSAGILSLKHQI